MSLWKRAMLHVRRKRGKTVVLFLILLIMFTLSLIGLSVQQAATSSATALRESLGGYFSIKANTKSNAPQRVDDGLISRVAAEDGVAAVNRMNTYYLNTGELFLEPGSFSVDPTDPKGKVPRFLGNSESELHDQFLIRAMTLKEGRHITSHDKGKALISDVLADYNNLTIGDSFTAVIDADIVGDANSPAIGTTFTFEVVGIFTINQKLPAGVGTPERDLSENFIFTDITTGLAVDSAVREQDVSFYRGGANFILRDPRDAPSLITRLQEDDSIGWEGLTLSINTTAYDNAVHPLNQLGGFITLLITVILLLSAALLSLILAMWCKNRVQEMGIFLSIGIGKFSIMAQFLVECLLIAVFAFMASFALTWAGAGQIGNLALSAVTQQQAPQEESASSAPGYDPNPLPKVEVEAPKAIEVKVGWNQFYPVLLAGIGVIILSVSLASISVIRLKPKQILTKIS